jgi:hypothetical protein
MKKYMRGLPLIERKRRRVTERIIDCVPGGWEICLDNQGYFGNGYS